ncbi:cold-inducible protein YdjO-related protein [Paenibacillus thermoaerophilus]|uniref:Cold-inducible protein YdjO-related protein n=1 Tax=Paenibacillus thermoaerophilus TaxID=1215385 RepID=A0ABW2V440_9BACL|nr:cold-inducible protein YdjO-related protein [Paenibacillus thermoaerophilus]
MQTETAKPDIAPVPIWRCKTAGCKAWMREELAPSPHPACPICKGPMIRSIKHLPKLVTKYKAKKK